MKPHILIRLERQLPDDYDIPDWVAFIHDKSYVKQSVTPAIDALMRKAGLEFWITSEYPTADDDWTEDEIRHGLDRTYRMILTDDEPVPPDLIEQLRRTPGVESAHPVTVSAVDLPPRDYARAQSTASAVSELIGLDYARALTTGVPEVKIAVLDTGVNLDHKELKGRVVAGANFVNLQGLDTTGFIGNYMGLSNVPEDEVGHGTHVSGILAARGLEMEEGVCPGCGVMAVRVLATMKSGGRLVGAGIVENINTGIKWAVDNGAGVINMSLGIKHVGGGLPHADVIRYALAKGVTVVAASGNDGTAERYYPGALPGVIAVGAVDDSGAVTSFTSYGANITVVAPGMNIYSSYAHNTYAFASGTSQASPFVAGMAALLKSLARQQGRSLGNAELRAVLRDTSDRIDGRLRNEHAGYGLVNFPDAFKYLDHWLTNDSPVNDSSANDSFANNSDRGLRWLPTPH
jgi:thermitase